MAYYSARSHGTNPYFQNWDASNEQGLLESLIIDSIKQYGQNCYYMPRNTANGVDPLYTESDQSTFPRAFTIELYIKSVDGFEGDGTFLSKFGLNIQDQVTFTVAKRIFETEIGHEINEPRPMEGDVIYFPLNGMLFQVLYANYKPFFYQLGALQTYDLVCGTFQYSGETFNTGFDFIDSIQTRYSTNILDYTIMSEDGLILQTESGDYLTTEQYNMSNIVIGSDNDYINDALANGVSNTVNVIDSDDLGGSVISDDNLFGNNNIIDWSEADPFSEGNY